MQFCKLCNCAIKCYALFYVFLKGENEGGLVEDELCFNHDKTMSMLGM